MGFAVCKAPCSSVMGSSRGDLPLQAKSRLWGCARGGLAHADHAWTSCHQTRADRTARCEPAGAGMVALWGPSSVFFLHFIQRPHCPSSAASALASPSSWAPPGGAAGAQLQEFGPAVPSTCSLDGWSALQMLIGSHGHQTTSGLGGWAGSQLVGTAASMLRGSRPCAPGSGAACMWADGAGKPSRPLWWLSGLWVLGPAIPLCDRPVLPRTTPHFQSHFPDPGKVVFHVGDLKLFVFVALGSGMSCLAWVPTER